MFGLAIALEEVGTREADQEADQEADRFYLRFIEEHPNSPMVKQAEKARTAFADKRLKVSAVGRSRPDVMMYISQALQTFEKLDPQRRQETGLEIAILGLNGPDINDPDVKYTLKALPWPASIILAAFRFLHCPGLRREETHHRSRRSLDLRFFCSPWRQGGPVFCSA